MMMVPTAASVTRHERVAPSMISEHATAETAGEIRAVCPMLSSTPMRFQTSHA